MITEANKDLSDRLVRFEASIMAALTRAFCMMALIGVVPALLLVATSNPSASQKISGGPPIMEMISN